MNHSEPARTSTRRHRSTILVILIVGATLVGLFIDQSQGVSPSPPSTGESSAPALDGTGHVRRGVTVFDDQTPAVAHLDPALLGALRRAADDAASDGIEFQVNSGWRSPEYQEQLLREAISEYGSEAEAARWVAPPEKSAHVSGDAVDLGPSKATTWLSEHGSAYGLCRIYGNEPWHFELRPQAVSHGCPAMYADPTHDPRMQ